MEHQVVAFLQLMISYIFDDFFFVIITFNTKKTRFLLFF